MSNTNNSIDSTKVAAALMILRGETVDQVAKNSHLQPENFHVWLKTRLHGALNAAQFSSLFQYLGIEKRQLADNYVHFWKIPFNGKKMSPDHQKALSYLQSFLKDSAICELKNIPFSRSKKTRYFMVRTKTARLILELQGQWRTPTGLSKSELPEVSLRQVNGQDKQYCVCLPEYVNAVKSHILTVGEYDELFAESQDTVSWENLRLIARAHKVTPSQLASLILAQNMKGNYLRQLVDSPMLEQLSTLDLGAMYQLSLTASPKSFFDHAETVTQTPTVTEQVKETKEQKVEVKPVSTPRNRSRKTTVKKSSEAKVVLSEPELVESKVENKVEAKSEIKVINKTPNLSLVA